MGNSRSNAAQQQIRQQQTHINMARESNKCASSNLDRRYVVRFACTKYTNDKEMKNLEIRFLYDKNKLFANTK